MYCDKAYFLQRIKQGDIDELTGGVDLNLEEAIKDADSLIDSYLRSKYSSLPLADPPEAIRQASYAIATYYLHDRTQYNLIPEKVEQKYKTTISYLKDLAAGNANLVDGLSDTDKETGFQVEGDEPVFKRDSLF